MKQDMLDDVKRHLDYVNATNQKSIRDIEMQEMYFEIERLKDENEKLTKEWLKSQEKRRKAIEYIENTYIGSILEVHSGYEEEYTKPLLDILKGSDKG